MFRATRNFIKARQPHTRYPLSVPKVRRIGGGKPNACFENAIAVEKSSKSGNTPAICVSGWLVQPYDMSSHSTVIIQHYWNIDAMGKHFDSSPLNDRAEYVLDMGLYEFGKQNYARIKRNVTMILSYDDGTFSSLIDEAQFAFQNLSELATEFLFIF